MGEYAKLSCMKPLEKRIVQRKIAEAKQAQKQKRIEKTQNPTENRRAWRSTERARRGLARVVFSRGFLIALLVLIQILIWVVIFQALPQYANKIQILARLISVAVVILIVNAAGTDATKLTWLVFIIAFPIAGTAFYLYFRYDIGVRAIGKRLETLRVDTAGLMRQNAVVRRDLHQYEPELYGLSVYLTRQVGFPAYVNKKATYYPGGEKFFQALIPEMEKAEKFIFLEFFIVDFGILWDRVLDCLLKKVEQGVEVRLLYDGMCSLNKLPINYWKKLNELGIKCKVFNQLRPVVSSVQNNRDHRKICVIDGKSAYTGGVNIADEYINQRERFGYWKDAGIRIEGEAVRSFTVMFLQMWNITEEKTEDFTPYFSMYRRGPYDRDLPAFDTGAPDGVKPSFVVPYGDSPFDNEDVGRNVYLYLLQHAHSYVHIMTPYLILDKGMRRALCQAAKCGTQVRIIMPHIPDKKYAYILGRSYYKELLSAGVQIYEYEEGFVHAKVWVVDSKLASVGSVNLDFRSLYWHFECGALVCDPETAADVEADFKNTFLKCNRISMVDAEQRSLGEKALGAVLRIVAPIM